MSASNRNCNLKRGGVRCGKPEGWTCLMYCEQFVGEDRTAEEMVDDPDVYAVVLIETEHQWLSYKYQGMSDRNFNPKNMVQVLLYGDGAAPELWPASRDEGKDTPEEKPGMATVAA